MIRAPFAIAFSLCRIEKPIPPDASVVDLPSLFSVAWWIPYTSSVQRRIDMPGFFGQTCAFLPEMNGSVPNATHAVYHASLLIAIALTIPYFSPKLAA